MEQWIILSGGFVYLAIIIIAKGVFDEIWDNWPEYQRTTFAIFWICPTIISIIVVVVIIWIVISEKLAALAKKILYNPGKILGKNIKKTKDRIMRL